MVQPRTVVGLMTREIIAQCFEFHDSTDAIAAERICFDHELVRDQNKCVLCGDCVRACHEIQSIGAIDFRVKIFYPGLRLIVI